jgi:Palmitoyl protein thioesterase
LNLSAWLADINNEREEKNETYAYHLSSLEKLVMIKFQDDKTVVPPDSSVYPPDELIDINSGLVNIMLRVMNIPP